MVVVSVKGKDGVGKVLRLRRIQQVYHNRNVRRQAVHPEVLVPIHDNGPDEAAAIEDLRPLCRSLIYISDLRVLILTQQVVARRGIPKRMCTHQKEERNLEERSPCETQASHRGLDRPLK